VAAAVGSEEDGSASVYEFGKQFFSKFFK
jgi:hypothetical protein